eukprot:m.71355 g.71355  ORF g.71355 m.71355 type:complete len:342 (+) comp24341_c2_seq1:255-1280(+)
MASRVVTLCVFLTATHVSDALLSCAAKVSVHVFSDVYIVAPGCHQNDIAALESLLHLELTDVSCTGDGLLDFGGNCNESIVDFREFSREDSVNVICDEDSVRYGSEDECNTAVDVLNLAIENVLLSANGNDPYPDLDPHKTMQTQRQEQHNKKNTVVLSGSNNEDRDTSPPKENILATSTGHVGVGGGGGGGVTLSLRAVLTPHRGSTSWMVGIGVAFVLSVVMVIIVAAKTMLKAHGAGIRKSKYVQGKDDPGISDEDAFESTINYGNHQTSKSISAATPPVGYIHPDWCTEPNSLQERAHNYGVMPRTPGRPSAPVPLRRPTVPTMSPPRLHHSLQESL